MTQKNFKKHIWCNYKTS